MGRRASLLLASIACIDTGAVDSVGAPTAFRSALLLHASFDRGLDADLAVGDSKLYTATNGNRSLARPGLPDGGLVTLARGKGFPATLCVSQRRCNQ
jgi:hypothetical protein